MVRRDDLLEKARRNPGGLRFEELLRLAESFGWKLARKGGTSHKTYKKEEEALLLTFQPGPNGKAHEYQVKQFLRTIRDEDECR